MELLTKNAVLDLALCCGATEKNSNIGAQQFILYTTAKIIPKIYFLYDFWCAQTSIRAIFGLPVRSLSIAAGAI